METKIKAVGMEYQEKRHHTDGKFGKKRRTGNQTLGLHTSQESEKAVGLFRQNWFGEGRNGEGGLLYRSAENKDETRVVGTKKRKKGSPCSVPVACTATKFYFTEKGIPLPAGCSS